MTGHIYKALKRLKHKGPASDTQVDLLNKQKPIQYLILYDQIKLI